MKLIWRIQALIWEELSSNQVALPVFRLIYPSGKCYVTSQGCLPDPQLCRRSQVFQNIEGLVGSNVR